MARKRRNFSAEFKAQIVLALLTGEKSVAEASREYQIKDTVLARWKQEFVERAAQVFEPAQELQERERRIGELEQMLGRLTLQLELSKKVLRYAPSQPPNNE
jgi:transposase-like protein